MDKKKYFCKYKAEGTRLTVSWQRTRRLTACAHTRGWKPVTDLASNESNSCSQLVKEAYVFTAWGPLNQSSDLD